jgi:hypothetical protein
MLRDRRDDAVRCTLVSWVALAGRALGCLLQVLQDAALAGRMRIWVLAGMAQRAQLTFQRFQRNTLGVDLLDLAVQQRIDVVARE